MRFILLLLSIVIIMIQGFLGLADWWILGSNWILAGLVILALIMAFDHERIAGFNNGALFQKAWVLLASLLNLNAIYLQPSLDWWKQDLISIGFVALISVGLGCWQYGNKPVRMLVFGLIVAIMACIYSPMIFSFLFVVLLLILMSSYTTRNVLSLLSGIVTTTWLIYILTTVFFGSEAEKTLVSNFVDSWRLNYQLPVFTGDVTAGMIVIGMVVFFIFLYAVGGMLVDNLNSLRIRSSITVQCILCFVLILAMPSCWSLYVSLASISLCVNLIFALNGRPGRREVTFARIMLACVMVAGIGEPIFRFCWDYFMND